MQEFVRVAKASDLSPGEMMLVEVGEESILLSNVDGEFYAVGEVCTHAQGPLSEGRVQEGQVACPWHDSRFSLKTGEVIKGPAIDPLPRYSVRIEGDDILVGPP